MTTKSKF